MPKVSISIPTYNGAPFLEECLESALCQTFADIEIVVVDDCSTDETFAIAEKFAKHDRRIKIFRNKNRLGLAQNWNRSIQYSTGEWIKFLFQDDSLRQDCIKSMLHAAASSKRGVPNNFVVGERNFKIENGVGQNLRQFYENMVITLGDVFGGKDCVMPQEFSGAILETGVGINFIGEPTSVMLRRDMCFQYSFFNKNLIHLCDLEYWSRIGTNEGVVYIPECLCEFRVHNRSASAHNHAHKPFELAFLDKIILLHDYLYQPWYENLRKISNSATILSNRLKYEIRNLVDFMASFDKGENRVLFRDLISKYQILKEYLDE